MHFRCLTEKYYTNESGMWLQNPQLGDSRCILVVKFYIRYFALKIIQWHMQNDAK